MTKFIIETKLVHLNAKMMHLNEFKFDIFDKIKSSAEVECRCLDFLFRRGVCCCIFREIFICLIFIKIITFSLIPYLIVVVLNPLLPLNDL